MVCCKWVNEWCLNELLVEGVSGEVNPCRWFEIYSTDFTKPNRHYSRGRSFGKIVSNSSTVSVVFNSKIRA